MTVHNGITRFTDLQRAAKIVFGLDSGEGGIERLSESVTVTKDLWSHPEDALARGAHLCSGGVFVAAGGAGNYSAACLDMPTAGWIARLRRLDIVTPTAGFVAMKRGLPFPTSSNNRSNLDTRVDNVLPIARLSTINNVAAVPGGTTCGAWYIAANSLLSLPVDALLVAVAPIASETGIIVYHGTANTALSVTAFWEERRLLPGELFR